MPECVGSREKFLRGESSRVTMNREIEGTNLADRRQRFTSITELLPIHRASYVPRIESLCCDLLLCSLASQPTLKSFSFPASGTSVTRAALSYRTAAVLRSVETHYASSGSVSRVGASRKFGPRYPALVQHSRTAGAHSAHPHRVCRFRSSICEPSMRPFSRPT